MFARFEVDGAKVLGFLGLAEPPFPD